MATRKQIQVGFNGPREEADTELLVKACRIVMILTRMGKNEANLLLVPTHRHVGTDVPYFPLKKIYSNQSPEQEAVGTLSSWEIRG